MAADDPTQATRKTADAKRLNKSQLVNDLIEQSLGAEHGGQRAAALLDEVLAGIKGSGNRDSAKKISSRLKKTLRARRVKHAAR